MRKRRKPQEWRKKMKKNDVCDGILKDLCLDLSNYLDEKRNDKYSAGGISTCFSLLERFRFIDSETHKLLNFSLSDSDFIAVMDNVIDTLCSSAFAKDIYCTWRKGVN